MTIEKLLYPAEIPYNKLHPTKHNFSVRDRENGMGIGVQALVGFDEGAIMCSFSGIVGTEVTQHTLQISEGKHMHDPWFLGMLSHSCSPNVLLNMSALLLIAQKTIHAGEWLAMDYRTTEATLYTGFPCNCGGSGCRKFIKGYKANE